MKTGKKRFMSAWAAVVSLLLALCPVGCTGESVTPETTETPEIPKPPAAVYATPKELIGATIGGFSDCVLTFDYAIAAQQSADSLDDAPDGTPSVQNRLSLVMKGDAMDVREISVFNREKEGGGYTPEVTYGLTLLRPNGATAARQRWTADDRATPLLPEDVAAPAFAAFDDALVGDLPSFLYRAVEALKADPDGAAESAALLMTGTSYRLTDGKYEVDAAFSLTDSFLKGLIDGEMKLGDAVRAIDAALFLIQLPDDMPGSVAELVNGAFSSADDLQLALNIVFAAALAEGRLTESFRDPLPGETPGAYFMTLLYGELGELTLDESYAFILELIDLPADVKAFKSAALTARLTFGADKRLTGGDITYVHELYEYRNNEPSGVSVIEYPQEPHGGDAEDPVEDQQEPHGGGAESPAAAAKTMYGGDADAAAEGDRNFIRYTLTGTVFATYGGAVLYPNL